MTGIEIVRLSDAIGAEIRGLDLTQPLSLEAVKIVEQAWYDHVIILIRNQDLRLDQQKDFAANFGEIAVRGGNAATKTERQVSESVMLVSNIRENGKPIGTLPDGEMMFHSDTPYTEHPLKATLLYAIEIPSKGGETLFSNSYKVAETLPENVKRRLADKKAMHVYDYGSTAVPSGSYDRSSNPHHAHPVFRKHPMTGRSSLFVSELMTVEIEDVPEEESQELLDILFKHQRRSEFVYAHSWRPGDLMMWDNRCSVHARNDFPSDERRMLRRLTLIDEHPVLPGAPPFLEAVS